MSHNIKYHAEIRKWNTNELINTLHLNGLSDCCDAIQYLQIDGNAFLNLSEGQLSFWRNHLTNIQIRRIWSVIQLARERPQDFVGDEILNKQSKAHQEIEKIRSPIKNSLENILGQQTFPNTNTVQEESVDYENNETILQKQAEEKLYYNNLPPKPNRLQQAEPPILHKQNIRHVIPIEKSPMKYAKKEATNFQNRHFQKPVQPIQPIIQNPEIIVSGDANANSFLHFNRGMPPMKLDVKRVESPASFPTNTTRRGNSPIGNRPVPEPPQNIPQTLEEIVLPRPPQGYLPGLVVDEEQPLYVDIDGYKTEPWFMDIDRKQAIDVLKRKPNGTFIARPSKRKDCECSLSITYNNRIYNVAIVKSGNKLIIGNQDFNSVNEIINYFTNNEMVLNGIQNEDIVVILRQL